MNFRKQAVIFLVILQGALAAEKSPVVAKFEMLSGHVQYRLQGGQWKDAKLGLALPAFTELETGPRSKVILVFANGSTLALNSLTSVMLDKYGTGSYGSQVVMSLRSGRLLAKIPKNKNGAQRHHFYVRTPTVVAGVRGTIEEISYSPDRGSEIKMHESGSDVVDRNRAKTLLPHGGQSTANREGAMTADKTARRAQTTTLVSSQVSTAGEAEFSYTSGDFTFSPNSPDFTEFLRIYERFAQDAAAGETLILDKL